MFRNTSECGDGRLNPSAPCFHPINAYQSLQEDLLAMKLLYFEEKIESNRKDETIARLQAIINDLLSKEIKDRLEAKNKSF